MLPISASDARKLVDDEDFPPRFFINQIVRRRLVSRAFTPAGRAWFIRDWHFSAMTLQRDEDNSILGIIITGDDLKYSNINEITNRIVKSAHLCQHPLFPIVVAADGALEDYRELSDELLVNSEDVHHSLGLPFKYEGARRLKHVSQDPATSLTNLINERERLIRLAGDTKAFYASTKTLLDLKHTASSVSMSGVSAGKSTSEINDSIEAMLEYLVAASQDILERVAATDARMQMLFASVSNSVKT